MSSGALDIINRILNLEIEKNKEADQIMSEELHPYLTNLIVELMEKLSECKCKGAVLYLTKPCDYYIESDNPKLMKCHYFGREYKRAGSVDIKTFLKDEIKTPTHALLLLNGIQIAERHYNIRLFGVLPIEYKQS